jgi:FixJ family two-component response regulator
MQIHNQHNPLIEVENKIDVARFLVSLSPVEVKLANAIMKGLSVREWARQMGITDYKAYRYRTAIQKKAREYFDDGGKNIR